MKNQTERKPDSALRKFGLFAVIIGDLVGYTGAGIALGYVAWKYWGAPWWVLVISSLFGMAWAFYRIYLLSRREL